MFCSVVSYLCLGLACIGLSLSQPPPLTHSQQQVASKPTPAKGTALQVAPHQATKGTVLSALVFVVSCLALLCLVLPCLAFTSMCTVLCLCPVFSSHLCFALPRRVLPCLASFYLALPSLPLPSLAFPCRILPCLALSCLLLTSCIAFS